MKKENFNIHPVVTRQFEALADQMTNKLANSSYGTTETVKLNVNDDDGIITNMITVLACKKEDGVITMAVMAPTADKNYELCDEAETLRQNIFVSIKETYMKHLKKQREEMMKRAIMITDITQIQ